jgi:serine protease Do
MRALMFFTTRHAGRARHRLGNPCVKPCTMPIFHAFKTLLVACAVMGFSATTAHAVPESFAPILEDNAGAVVNISTTQKVKNAVGFPFQFNFDALPNDPKLEPFRQFFEQFQNELREDGDGTLEREEKSLGSGFVIDGTRGYIVTNNHVVTQADEIQVTFQDKTKLPAEIIGLDPKTDLALLKVQNDTRLPEVRFGNSDTLKVGDWVVAVGNPFGLGGTVTAGIVSARGRNINQGPFDDFIQTDAAINRGNSGGPLFNTKGEVVGISSAIFSPTGGNVGIGFAVPASLAEPIIEQLRAYGKAQRAWLGVKIQQVTDEIANSLGLGEPRGALVIEVSKDGPSHGSGIAAGDIIVQFDGKAIEEMRDLPRTVASTEIGKRVKVVVWRDGKEHSYRITLGELPEDQAGAPSVTPSTQEKTDDDARLFGMALEPASATLRKRFGIEKSQQGIVVSDVARGSVAQRRGLRQGDVILQVNQQTVTDVAQLQRAFATAKKAGKDFALLRVARGNSVQFITLPTKEEK